MPALAVHSVLPVQELLHRRWDSQSRLNVPQKQLYTWGRRQCSQRKTQQEGNHMSAHSGPQKRSSWPFGIACNHLRWFTSWVLWAEGLCLVSLLIILSTTPHGEDTSASGPVECFHSPSSFLQCFFFLPAENRIIYSRRQCGMTWGGDLLGRWKLLVCESLCLRQIGAKDSLRKSKIIKIFKCHSEYRRMIINYLIGHR